MILNVKLDAAPFCEIMQSFIFDAKVHDQKYEAQLWTYEICQKKYFVCNLLNSQSNKDYDSELGISLKILTNCMLEKS